ncbi:hypothetical protein [Komagataeibacter intermedius]
MIDIPPRKPAVFFSLAVTADDRHDERIGRTVGVSILADAVVRRTCP